MRTKPIQHKWSGLFVLLIFALFAGCLLLVLLTGAGSYQRLSQRDARSYESSTAFQYVASKLHHADRAGAVQIGSFAAPNAGKADEITTLYLWQEIDGERYATRIYYYDGFMRELFSAAELSMSPEAGNPILACAPLTFTQEGDLLRLTQTDAEGQESSLLLYPRSEGKVGA